LNEKSELLVEMAFLKKNAIPIGRSKCSWI